MTWFDFIDKHWSDIATLLGVGMSIIGGLIFFWMFSRSN